MAPRLSSQTSIFGVVFFVAKSLLGIERQEKREKLAILTRKPRSHVRILIYRTWPIHTVFANERSCRTKFWSFTHKVIEELLYWNYWISMKGQRSFTTSMGKQIPYGTNTFRKFAAVLVLLFHLFLNSFCCPNKHSFLAFVGFVSHLVVPLSSDVTPLLMEGYIDREKLTQIALFVKNNSHA